MAWYRGRYISHQLQRGAYIPTWRKPRNCADARWLAKVWVKRAFAARVITYRHLREIAQRSLQDFVRERLSPHMVPREVRFVDELPKTPSGKLDRKALA